MTTSHRVPTSHVGKVIIALSCTFTSGVFCDQALAQEPNESSPVAPLPAGDTCTPECAPGFECTQGFCVALESEPNEAKSESITAPGLALGAETPTKPNTQSKTTPTPHQPTVSDDGEDRDDRPKTADIQEWSDYRHQGFYLRLGLGVGLAWVSGSRSAFENFGIGRAEAELTGEGELSIGGTIGPVAFGYRGLVSADITAFSGGFVDVYPDPLEGLHIEGSFGLGGAGIEDMTATFGVGHDFFFAREWSFGLTARALRSFGAITVSIVSLNASILCH